MSSQSSLLESQSSLESQEIEYSNNPSESETSLPGSDFEYFPSQSVDSQSTIEASLSYDSQE